MKNICLLDLNYTLVGNQADTRMLRPVSYTHLDVYKRQALESRRKSLTEFATQRGVIKAKLEAISEAEAQTAKLRRDIEDAAATLNDYTVLTQAFGLDGIQSVSYTHLVYHHRLCCHAECNRQRAAQAIQAH